MRYAAWLERQAVRDALGCTWRARDATAVPPPGTLVSLTERDEAGAYRRSIVKVTNPSRYGLTVGDYFV